MGYLSGYHVAEKTGGQSQVVLTWGRVFLKDSTANGRFNNNLLSVNWT